MQMSRTFPIISGKGISIGIDASKFIIDNNTLEKQAYKLDFSPKYIFKLRGL